MESNNLDQTFKDVTFTHYIAHNISRLLPFQKHYYRVLPTAGISFIHVSVLSNDWLVMGVIPLTEKQEASAGDALAVRPVNQNNAQAARTTMHKYATIKVDLKDPDFINQVYINVYQQNNLLLGMKSNQRYFIEVKNTRDATVYYNINIKFADGSQTDH